MAFDIQPPKKKRPIPKPEPVKEVKPVVKKVKKKVETQDVASTEKSKTKVKKVKAIKTAKPSKAKKSGSGAGVKFVITLIGIALIAGGVFFIRQNNMNNTKAKKPAGQAGVVNQFGDTEPESVVPVDDGTPKELTPEEELVNMHNAFINNLESGDTPDIPNMYDDFISDFNEYLNEF